MQKPSQKGGAQGFSKAGPDMADQRLQVGIELARLSKSMHQHIDHHGCIKTCCTEVGCATRG